MAYLTYAEARELAQKNYYKGGDVFEECWDEKTFSFYENEFGRVTKKRLFEMFKLWKAEEDEAAAFSRSQW